jgi:cell division protein FtsN
LSEQSPRSGLVVSGALHAALLAAILIGVTGAPKFDDAAESIPVETITQNQFNEIMKGERDAKPAKPIEKPTPPVEASAPKPLEQAPNDPPPPPQKTEEAKPAQLEPAAPTPPERPAAPQREAAAPPTPPPPPDAEIDKPQARTDPQPPPTPPAPPARPKLAEKPKPDQAAKPIDEAKPDQPPKPPAKPKSDAPNERRFDPNSIAKLLGQGKPRNIEQVASATPLGLPTQNAERMSPSISAAIDGWLTDAYLRCWQPPPTMPDGAKYVAEIKVAFNPDGSLSTHPLLINPPSDPAWRAYADSAMRAVMRCNPLQVPPQYAPYFEQWRSKTVHFDPENALG